MRRTQYTMETCPPPRRGIDQDPGRYADRTPVPAPDAQATGADGRVRDEPPHSLQMDSRHARSQGGGMIARLSDWLRERRIAHLRQQFATAYTIADRRRLWLRLRDEINDRSPDQVQRMERARGLARSPE